MIDHIVLAVPELAAGCTWFAEATGVVPAAGGRHLGLGTANRLVGLGGGRYLEIIGPDPGGPNPDRPRPFGIDRRAQPHLVTWASATGDIDTAVTRARAAGYDPGPPREMSRRTPDGTVLSWRLTLAADGVDSGVVPFLIDWGSTAHPSGVPGLPGVGLVSLEIVAADPGRVRRAATALGFSVPITVGRQDALHLRLATPQGPVSIT